MVKKFWLLALFIFMAGVACAQSSDSENSVTHAGKYCLSYTDYLDGKWVDVNSLTRVTRSQSAKLWSGGGDYKFEAQDGEQEKTLKKKAFAILFNDTLYVNIGPLRHSGAKFGNGYDQAYKMDGNRLVLLAPYVSRAKSMSIGVAGGLGGAIGGAIAGSASASAGWNNKVCYLISSADTKIQCIDEEVMPGLLASHPALLERYNKIDGRKERRKAEQVMPLLIEAGLLK